MENKDKQIQESIKHDFTEEELDSLEDWVKNNKPGIHSLTDSTVIQWFELYMSGKSYTEISKITRSKKDLILFVSKRQNWFLKKNEYFKDISSNILQKYMEAKIETANTMTTMVTAMNKYFGKKFNKYLKDNDEKIIESIDSKMLAQYHKISESLDKILAESTGSGDGESKTPLVNVNIHSGAKVSQTDENTLDVSFEEEAEVKDILESLSKVKKIRESEK